MTITRLSIDSVSSVAIGLAFNPAGESAASDLKFTEVIAAQFGTQANAGEFRAILQKQFPDALIEKIAGIPLLVQNQEAFVVADEKSLLAAQQPQIDESFGTYSNGTLLPILSRLSNSHFACVFDVKALNESKQLETLVFKSFAVDQTAQVTIEINLNEPIIFQLTAYPLDPDAAEEIANAYRSIGSSILINLASEFVKILPEPYQGSEEIETWVKGLIDNTTITVVDGIVLVTTEKPNNFDQLPQVIRQITSKIIFRLANDVPAEASLKIQIVGGEEKLTLTKEDGFEQPSENNGNLKFIYYNGTRFQTGEIDGPGSVEFSIDRDSQGSPIWHHSVSLSD